MHVPYPMPTWRGEIEKGRGRDQGLGWASCAQVSRPRHNGSHRAWWGPDACVPNPVTPALSKGVSSTEGAYADANAPLITPLHWLEKLDGGRRRAMEQL